MYFSKHNENVTFSYTYGSTLEVEAKGSVCKEDTDVEPCSNKNWSKEHYRIELTEGITSVGAGFLDVFVNMEELIIHRSVRNIEVTPQLKKILNNVTIRGWRKTYAEKFAGQYGLKFLQADIMVGWHRTDYSNTKLTIRFKKNGTPYLEYDEYTSGISAGNCGGGTRWILTSNVGPLANFCDSHTSVPRYYTFTPNDRIKDLGITEVHGHRK